MVKTNKIEKTILISTVLVLSLMASFVISELINASFGGEFNISIVWYNFRHLHYAVLAPFVMPFFMIKEIDLYSNSFNITTTVILTALIPAILYFIFRLITQIKKGEFKSIFRKWINYISLFLILELWFLIGLIPAGMERL